MTLFGLVVVLDIAYPKNEEKKSHEYNLSLFAFYDFILFKYLAKHTHTHIYTYIKVCVCVCEWRESYWMLL